MLGFARPDRKADAVLVAACPNVRRGTCCTKCAWEVPSHSEHQDWIYCVDSIVEEMKDLEEEAAS
jgi:hypothetical protein